MKSKRAHILLPHDLVKEIDSIGREILEPLESGDGKTVNASVTISCEFYTATPYRESHGCSQGN